MWVVQLLLLLLVGLSACTKENLNRSEPSNPNVNSKNALPLPAVSDRPSEDNGGLPGYPLSCQHMQKDATTAELDCRILSEDKSKLRDLSQELSSWDFSLSFVNNEAILDVTKLGKAKEGFHASWQLHADAGADLKMILSSTVISFRGTRHGGGNLNVEQNWQLSELEEISEIDKHQAKPAFKHYRIVIHSIEFSGFQNPNACIQYLQLYFNGDWQSTSIDEVGNVSIAGQQLELSASSGLNLAHDAFLVPGFWESDPGTYLANEPFDASGTASWIGFTFPQSPISLEGFVILGGDPNFTSGECAPDLISIEASNDSLTWQTIGDPNYRIESNFNMTEIFW